MNENHITYSENCVSFKICDERCKRLEEEDKRQNHRIDLLEDSTREMRAIAISVEKLATTMESMVKEQEKQGERLEALEERDAEKWRKVAGYVGTTILGIILAFIAAKLGIAV